MERQLATGKPFIITLDRPFVTDLAKFLDEAGGRSFRTSASAFQLPLQSQRIKLREYHRRFGAGPTPEVEGPPIPYVFHDLLGNDDRRERGRARDPWRVAELARWSSRCPPPEFFVRMSARTPAVAARIAFGPAGTHSGLHRHGASTCQLIFGSKRWNLHEVAVTSRLKPLIEGLRVAAPQTFWWNHVVPKIEGVRGDVRVALRRALLNLSKRGLFDTAPLVQLEQPLDAAQAIGERFTQRVGEIVYLPPFWGHSTINDDWSLAFVLELQGDEAIRAALRRTAPAGRTRPIEPRKRGEGASRR